MQIFSAFCKDFLADAGGRVKVNLSTRREGLTS